AQAQCSLDLTSTQAALASSQAALAAANADSDQDGRRDVDDACPNTAPGAAVDQAGCSLEQFCATFDAGTHDGKRACKHADWKNDEPVMRASERDCTIRRGATISDNVCVPAN